MSNPVLLINQVAFQKYLTEQITVGMIWAKCKKMKPKNNILNVVKSQVLSLFKIQSGEWANLIL
jgi:hypothetical protein